MGSQPLKSVIGTSLIPEPSVRCLLFNNKIRKRNFFLTMGNGHSLACNKGHIYEKINENVSKTQMGKRNESLVTLDVKINDLENNTEKTGHDDTTYAQCAHHVKTLRIGIIVLTRTGFNRMDGSSNSSGGGRTS